MILNGRIPPTWPEDKMFYVNKFFDIIVKNAPEYQLFGVTELLENFIDNEDRNRLMDISEILKTKIINTGLAERRGSWQFMIDENIRQSILNPKTERNEINKNEIHVHGNNYGMLNQGSLLENSPNIIKHSENPTKSQKSEKSGILIRFINFISNNALVSGFILLAITLYIAYKGWFVK